jgi:cytochrome P450
MPERMITWGGWDEVVQNDPFPLFESVRRRCPVRHVRLADGHDAWLVMSHEAARSALKDTRLSKDMVAAMSANPDVVDAGLPGPAFARHMLSVDPPDHTRLRRLVAPAFVPSGIADLEPVIQRIADDLLDELEAVGPQAAVDLVEGYAHPLPFEVICELLGVPTGMRSCLHCSFRALFQPFTTPPPREAVKASDAIVSCLQQLVATHRTTRHDDLVGVLVAASDDGALTGQELLSTLFQLIVAGYDTTTSLIGNAVVALLDHPGQLRRLRSDLAQMSTAVEELIRFSAPVPHATFRVTTQPVELAGETIPAGQQVLICLASANRDPDTYPNPGRLDVTRDSRSHLGFGHGIHFCLGAPLARLEARIALTTLFRRFPNVALAVDRSELRWSHGDGLVLRGLDQLPVRLVSGITA